ncbi:hypothetical protein VTN49DRAFT_3205 [Thermomyces lanuginosus]|uniref:uncharacterized protein n=1 Tax=Thermomyces lanuginosus TaxID=5541 RepID=UPI0037439AD4
MNKPKLPDQKRNPERSNDFQRAERSNEDIAALSEIWRASLEKRGETRRKNPAKRGDCKAEIEDQVELETPRQTKHLMTLVSRR